SSYHDHLSRFARDVEARYQDKIAELATPTDVQSDRPHKSLGDIGDLDQLVERLTAGIVARIQMEHRDQPTRASRKINDNMLFVLMASSEDMNPIFQGIQAAATAFGFEATRVEDTRGDFRISEKIIQGIEEAGLVLADLTHERPNVYFELGYA